MGKGRIAAALQWGRDQLIAETDPETQTLEITFKLQWGRDQLIAETRDGPTPSSPMCRRFNGAAIN